MLMWEQNQDMVPVVSTGLESGSSAESEALGGGETGNPGSWGWVWIDKN